MTEAEKERAAVVAWLDERIELHWRCMGDGPDKMIPAFLATELLCVRVHIQRGSHLESGEHLKEGR